MNQLDKELTQIERRICQNNLKYRRIQMFGVLIEFMDR